MLLCCVDFMLCNGLESPAGDGGSYYRLLAAAHWRAGEKSNCRSAWMPTRNCVCRCCVIRWSGGVEILDVAKPDTQLLNDNKRWLVSQEYTVTSFDSALYYLPPFEVLVNDKAYRSKALALKVYSIPVDTLHPDQFFGPKSIQEVPLTWEDLAPMVYSILLLIVLGVVTAFFIIRYRDNKPIIKIIKVEPKLPPHLAAMKKIETIKADKVAKREDPKAYYTELTDVIRIYIKERFGFNAMEMTSCGN